MPLPEVKQRLLNILSEQSEETLEKLVRRMKQTNETQMPQNLRLPVGASEETAFPEIPQQKPDFLTQELRQTETLESGLRSVPFEFITWDEAQITESLHQSTAEKETTVPYAEQGARPKGFYAENAPSINLAESKRQSEYLPRRQSNVDSEKFIDDYHSQIYGPRGQFYEAKGADKMAIESFRASSPEFLTRPRSYELPPFSHIERRSQIPAQRELAQHVAKPAAPPTGGTAIQAEVQNMQQTFQTMSLQRGFSSQPQSERTVNYIPSRSDSPQSHITQRSLPPSPPPVQRERPTPSVQLPPPIPPRRNQQRASDQMPMFNLQPINIVPLSGDAKLQKSGQNYISWTSDIELLLQREGTYPMVVNPPAQPWTPAMHELNTRACTTLLMSMETDLRLTLNPRDNAHLIWTQLENTYRPISLESTNLLIHEFYGCRIKPNQKIGDHLANMKAMRAKLQERGHHVDEEHMIAIIISSLNHEWRNVVARINFIPIPQRTADYVCRMLIEEEAVMQLLPNPDESSAPKAPVRHTSRGRAFAPSKPRCYACNRCGHIARDCPQKAAPRPDRGRGKRPSKRGSSRGSHPSTMTLVTSAQEPQDHPEYDRSKLWILDSGAAIHITNRKELFTEMQKVEPHLREVHSVLNHSAQIKGKGTVFIEELNTHIPNVYFVPSATNNLLSQSNLSQVSDFQVHHFKNLSYIAKNGEIVAETIVLDGIYYVKPKGKKQVKASISVPNKGSTGPERKPVATPKIPMAPKADSNAQVAQCKPGVPTQHKNVEPSLTGKPLHFRCVHRWHRRLGHISFDVLKKMSSFVKGLNFKGCKVFLDCVVCKKAKTEATTEPDHAAFMSTRNFELVHTDIVGPFPPTFGGNKYFLTIVDNHSRYGYVYPMRDKSQTFQTFKGFASHVQTQFNAKIARIQSDQGAEFMSQKFQDWMTKNGIVHQTSAPYTPAENGVAERRNGVLQSMMRCLLEDSGLSIGYWAEAVVYANNIINRVWTRVLNETPYYALYGRKPDLTHLHIFGSYAMVNIPPQQRKKGGPRAKRLRYIGISNNFKHSKFADSNHRVTFSRSANFEEDANWSKIHSNDPGVYFPRDGVAESTQPDVPTSEPDVPSSEAADDSVSDNEEGEDQTEEEEETVGPRRSKRTTKGVPPKRFTQQVSTPQPLLCNVNLPPENFAQIKHLPEPEQEKWFDAMQVEMDSLKNLQVFAPAKPPPQKKVIGTRWVYRIKKKPDGELLYKARLVAQGFAQSYPEDYTNTYSPTVRTESVKIALTTATILDLEVFQFDVETAYLHADLDEEIYVRGPPGFQKQEGDSWLLYKSLYGLKQSGLMWYLCLSEKLNSMGFIKSEIDECVFTKRNGSSYEIILVYVDDIVYIGPNKKMSNVFANSLQKIFTLKSLGHINTYLGVQIEKTEKGFSLSQEEKIEQLLHQCKMSDAKPASIPMQTDFHNLTHREGPGFEPAQRSQQLNTSISVIRCALPDFSPGR